MCERGGGGGREREGDFLTLSNHQTPYVSITTIWPACVCVCVCVCVRERERGREGKRGRLPYFVKPPNTVCFNSYNNYGWHVCVVRERGEREGGGREGDFLTLSNHQTPYVCIHSIASTIWSARVCVCERERERGGGGERETSLLCQTTKHRMCVYIQ